MKQVILILCIVVFAFSGIYSADETNNSQELSMQKMDVRHFDPVFPVTLIGTQLDGQVNFMTAAWVTRVEIDPYLFAVSIQKRHFTHKAIMENHTFSINIPTVDMLPQVDGVGMTSGKEYDKSEIFDAFYGDDTTIPMVNGSIISFECEVADTVNLVQSDAAHPSAHTLIIGRVKNVWVNKKGVKDNALDYETLKPVLWTMSPRNYWTVGEKQGQAFDGEHIKLIPKKK